MTKGREPGLHEEYLVVGEGVIHDLVRVPVHILQGAKPGPLVFLTGAVHGDEINGVAIVREVFCGLNPNTFSGTLVGIPVANVPGFRRGERYMPDRRDLNRSFPGDPEASLTKRTAFTLWDEVLRHCDYGIDLHTATEGRANLCHVRGDATNPVSRGMMRAFGTPVLLHGEGPKGSLRRHCTDEGIPTIIFEAGEPNRFQSHVVEIGVQGVLRTLRHLGMTKKRCSPKPSYQVLLKKSQWARTEHGGILDLRTRPGDLVRKNQVLARVLDPFGTEVSTVKSPLTGVVLGMGTKPLAHAGDAVAHVGRIRTTLQDAREYVSLGGDLGHIDWDVHGNQVLMTNSPRELEEKGRQEIEEEEHPSS